MLSTININAIALLTRPEKVPPRGGVPDSLGSSTVHVTAWHRHPSYDARRTLVSYNNLLKICLFPCSLVILMHQSSSRHWVSNTGKKAGLFLLACCQMGAEFGFLSAQKKNKDGGKPTLRYSIAAGDI